MPPPRPGSRVQRRVARTKAAIEDAFVQLVLEQGYERVAVEDISPDRADLARATFYAHYPNKEAVLLSVSNRLVEDLMQRIAYQGGPWNVVRRDAIQTAYKHAAEHPDLYRACMSDARTRQAYLSVVSRYAEQNFRDRLTALGQAAAHPCPGDGARLRGAHRHPGSLAGSASSKVTLNSSPTWRWTSSSPAEPGRTESVSTKSDTQPDPRPMPAHRRRQQQRQDHAVLSRPAPPRQRLPLENRNDAVRAG